MSIGEQPVMTDPMEAVRQRVLQEAPFPAQDREGKIDLLQTSCRRMKLKGCLS